MPAAFKIRDKRILKKKSVDVVFGNIPGYLSMDVLHFLKTLQRQLIKFFEVTSYNKVIRQQNIIKHNMKYCTFFVYDQVYYYSAL